MSTGDFQNKYASFMEGVVKSTIAETTKLFETLVDELKAELAKVKTENEALKTTCRKMEDVIGKLERSNMRDAAVQCELHPDHVLLMPQEAEQSTEEQGQQQQIVYILLNNYNTATQETSTVTVSPSNQEVSEPAVVGTQMIYAVADPQPTLACVKEMEVPRAGQQCPIEEVRSYDTQVTAVHPSLEKDQYLHKAENQSIETVNYINPPTPISSKLEMASCAGQVLSQMGTQQLVETQVQLELPSLGQRPIYKQEAMTACGPATDQRLSTEELRKSQNTLVTTVQPCFEQDENSNQAQNQLTETVNVLNSLIKQSGYTVVAPNVGQLVPEFKTQESETLQVQLLSPSFNETVDKKAEEENIEATLLKKQVQGQQLKCSPMEHGPKCDTKGQQTKLRRERKQPSEKVKHLQNIPKKMLWSPSSDTEGASRNEATSPQPMSHPLETGSSTVMLQDAMLLVEAMDQSKNLISQQEKVQDRCSLSAATLPVVQSPLPTQALLVQLPPTAKLSTNKACSVTDATSSSNDQSQISVQTVPQPNPGSDSLDMTTKLSATATASKSVEQCVPLISDLSAYPLETTPNSDLLPSNIIAFNEPPSPHPQCTSSPRFSTQISDFVSTTAASQDGCTSPASSGLPQRETEVTSTVAAPLVESDTTLSSMNQSSDQTQSKKIKIIICKTAEALGRPAQVSETQVEPKDQTSVEPTVTLSSQQPNMGISDETQASSEQMLLVSPTLTSPQLESSSEQLAVCEITPEEMAEVLSTENVPADSSPLVPVIRLKRLASLAFPAGSRLRSQILSRQRESEAVPLESTSSLFDDQASETTVSPSEVSELSTCMRPSSEEIPNNSSLPEESSPCSTLEEAPDIVLLPSSPSSVSEPVLNLTLDSDDDFSALSAQESQTSTPIAEMINNAEQNSISGHGNSTNSTSPVQLTPLTEDLPEPDLQPTKTDFLAQLEISPVLKDAQKESTGDQSPCEGISSDCQKKAQRLSIVTRLGLHLKKTMLGKRKRNAEPPTESPKKTRLDNVSTADQESTQESVPVCANTTSPQSLTATEFSQGSPHNQRSKEISYPTIKSVSANPRKPVVSLCRLALKGSTESAQVSASLPQNEVNSGDVSPPKDASESCGLIVGDTTERVSINSASEAGANKRFESAVSLRSNSTTSTTSVAKKKLSKQTLSTDNAVSDKSGDSNQSPGSGSIEDTVTQLSTPPSMVSGKPRKCRRENNPNELKATTVRLRSSTTKDYGRPETRSLKANSGVKKNRSPKGHSTHKNIASLPMKNISRSFPSPKNSRSLSVRQKDTSPVKDHTSSKQSELPTVSQEKSNSVQNVTSNDQSQLPTVSQKESSSVKHVSTPKKSQLPAASQTKNVTHLPAASQKESNSVKNVTTPKKSQLPAVSQKESSTVKNATSPKKSQSQAASKTKKVTHLPAASQKESNSVKNVTTPKKSQLPAVSQKESSSVKNATSPKKSQSPAASQTKKVTHLPAASQKESNSVKNVTSPKKSLLPDDSPKESSSVKNATSPKTSPIPDVSQKNSNSVENVAGPKKSKFPTATKKQSPSAKKVTSPKKSQVPAANQKESSSVKNTTSPKKSKLPVVTIKESSSVKNVTTPKKSKLPAVSEQESSPVKTVTNPKKSSSTEVNQKESSSVKNAIDREKIQIPPVGPNGPLLYRIIPLTELMAARQKEAENHSGSKISQLPTTSQNLSALSQNSPRAETSNDHPPRSSSSSKREKSPKRAHHSSPGKTSPQSLRSAKLAASSKTDKRPPKKARKGEKDLMVTNATKSKGMALAQQKRSKKRRQAMQGASPSQIVVGPEKPDSASGVTPPKPSQPLLKNQCGYCGRVLSGGCALEAHISLHTGYRPFRCVMCNKTFPDGKGLRRHVRVHSSGRMHICQQCGKGFVYGFGLTKHVQMVHGKLKPFVCQICDKAFFTKRDVETHIRSHTGERPFACHLCEKRFARRMELNVHLRWHRGEKRHWCPYCGKGFLDQNNLKRHKYIHTGEKPHSCPHCPKHFTQSGHLKKHVKNVHKIQ
ncbi:mucin-2-like [Corythoichthys intestinalis]|uniref:mucin-2-like n=1 Tax=Corythoichthys intestinalis TaxID=161448 RepID=UPI0025A64FFE|nr:mucin-2-like [Corythoichthys intestinalis]